MGLAWSTKRHLFWSQNKNFHRQYLLYVNFLKLFRLSQTKLPLYSVVNAYDWQLDKTRIGFMQKLRFCSFSWCSFSIFRHLLIVVMHSNSPIVCSCRLCWPLCVTLQISHAGHRWASAESRSSLRALQTKCVCICDAIGSTRAETSWYFRGQNYCNLLLYLYLTTKHIFANISGSVARLPSPLVADLGSTLNVCYQIREANDFCVVLARRPLVIRSLSGKQYQRYLGIIDFIRNC